MHSAEIAQLILRTYICDRFVVSLPEGRGGGAVEDRCRGNLDGKCLGNGQNRVEKCEIPFGAQHDAR